MEKIKVNDFVFEVDKKYTELIHDKRIPSSVECGCGNCKDFNKNRDKIFPKQLINFLEKFCLDYRKEDYFVSYNQEAPPFEVWYYIKGRILKDQNNQIVITDKIYITCQGENLVTNFLPEGLSSPYFLLNVWFEN